MEESAFKFGDIVRFKEAPDGEYYIVQVITPGAKNTFSGLILDTSNLYKEYGKIGSILSSFSANCYELHPTLNGKDTDELFNGLFSSCDDLEQKLKDNEQEKV